MGEREHLRLFVYGTLRRGMPAHGRLAGARFIARASVPGRLFDLGRYPALLEAEAPEDVVHGEAYELPDKAMLAAIDAYEGCRPGVPGSLFVRKEVEAMTEDGRRLACWAYFYNAEPASGAADARPIASGDYRTAGAP
jgi:gamma-glutamylcyclotransferase (GGCT)/AIG2-like uncharacterized protein YtfP